MENPIKMDDLFSETSISSPGGPSNRFFLGGLLLDVYHQAIPLNLKVGPGSSYRWGVVWGSYTFTWP